MTILWKFLTLVLLASLAACSGIPVSTDYDTSQNFSQLKTYAWIKPKKKLLIDPLVDNDLMDNRIHRAVEQRLAAQGFQKATGDEGADFFVSYYVSAQEKISVSSFQSSYGYYPCWGPCYGPAYSNDVWIRQYTEGTFMIDIIDPASDQLMWRGIADRRLSPSATPQECDLMVDSIVDAILSRFPPGLVKQ
ncbi:MAG: DUF4136 domain-containing protein [Halieaceae bacterium]|nr:DUF4136 domain-containing protein [Halieaceae bacterium]